MGDCEDSYVRFCTQFFERLYRRRKNDLAIVRMLSHLYAIQGNRQKSFRMDRRHAQLDTLDPIAHYNLACDYALDKKVPEAMHALKTAIALGYNDVQWMRDDTDLDPIRQEPTFRALMKHSFSDATQKQ